MREAVHGCGREHDEAPEVDGVPDAARQMRHQQRGDFDRDEQVEREDPPRDGRRTPVRHERDRDRSG